MDGSNPQMRVKMPCSEVELAPHGDHRQTVVDRGPHGATWPEWFIAETARAEGRALQHQISDLRFEQADQAKDLARELGDARREAGANTLALAKQIGESTLSTVLKLTEETAHIRSEMKEGFGQLRTALLEQGAATRELLLKDQLRLAREKATELRIRLGAQLCAR